MVRVKVSPPVPGLTVSLCQWMFYVIYILCNLASGVSDDDVTSTKNEVYRKVSFATLFLKQQRLTTEKSVL